MDKKLKTIYCCFPEGKYKALTMSYDDGREEDKRLVQLFNQYGIKGTFHLNSGYDWDPRRIAPTEFKKLYEGHEISCHTYTHPDIERCPMEQVALQILEDRKALETITGYPVRGLSYPYGSYNEEIKKLLPALGIRYSRIVGDSDAFGMPGDFYEWKPTCHHFHNLVELGKQFVALDTPWQFELMYVWGHSFEFDSEEKWKVIEDFCEIAGNRSDIWYATNIQIVDYMEAVKRLQFSADSSFVYNPSVQTIWLDVEEKIVEIPGGSQVTLF